MCRRKSRQPVVAEQFGSKHFGVNCLLRLQAVVQVDHGPLDGSAAQPVLVFTPDYLRDYSLKKKSKIFAKGFEKQLAGF